MRAGEKCRRVSNLWRWRRVGLLSVIETPPISRFVLWFFRRIVRGYFRREFTAVRVTRTSDLSGLQGSRAKRLLIYANHGSWWDPMMCVLLAQKLMPERKHYAPMDAVSLERYKILKHIGIFGVETKTARGAAQFLRKGLAVLAQTGVLWVTPQGRFADARERPLVFKPGLAALAARTPGGCTVQPLAIEYVFWNERLPEALLHFGEPVPVHGQTAAEIDAQLQAALLEAMELLRGLAMARDAAAFEVLQAGRAGTGGYYQFGQRLLAGLRGRRFQPQHTAPTGTMHPKEHG